MEYPIRIALLIILSLLVACKPEPKPQRNAEEGTVQDSTAAGTDVEREWSPDRQEKLAFLMGKFDPATRDGFVEVETRHAAREGMYLDSLAYAAFVRMHEAAAKDGIALVILSATRNFERQKQIWEAKWTGARLVGGENLAEAYPDSIARAYRILEWSSMPGTSRHHWGTDIDLNELDNAYFESGEGLEVYEWLRRNAGSHGFCQVYNEKGIQRPWGYNEEKWHWSYIPVAKRHLSDINYLLWNEDFSGFAGAGTAVEIMVKEKYILGINKDCLDL